MEIRLEKNMNGWTIEVSENAHTAGKKWSATNNWKMICKVLKPLMLPEPESEVALVEEKKTINKIKV